jgi:HEPN domain-containing protein
VCYLAHQSVEKRLKGYLISQGMVEPPYTHDLHLLYQLCTKYDVTFAEIYTYCQKLNIYGIRIKYPDEIIVDEHMVRRAISDAQSVKNFETLAKVQYALQAEYKEQFAVTRAEETTVSRPTSGKPRP